MYNSSTRDYSLYPVDAPNSAVEIVNGLPDNDAVVQIWTKPSSGLLNSQRFSIVRNSAGSYRLLSYSSGYTKVIAVKDASESDNAAIVQYTNNNSSSGLWFIEPANKTIKTNTHAFANSNYNREWAASYAETYAKTPNDAYEYLSNGGDCTNFVSQCLYAGTLPMLPTNAEWLITSKTDIKNWFYFAGLPLIYNDDWVAYAFSHAPDFNAHWGQTNMRAYQTITYASATDAAKDIDFLVWYLKKGDVIQLLNGGVAYHSMIVYNDNITCDGKHKGGANGSCPNIGKKEILYAQHSTDEIAGHLRALLRDSGSTGITFIKIKNDG